MVYVSLHCWLVLQVIALLQQDRASPAAAAAAPGNLEPPGCGPPGGRPPAAAAAEVQLDHEIQDLQEELLIARKDKKIIEEQYLAQIISVSSWLLADCRKCGGPVFPKC
eukprot:GHUV01052879.1.p2 GENE.GHUV01052879.1~~GHUV01052879.1.p2  ORF type:complete len:109 (-),score=47.32 GHUV01052879.1:391-717(-)